MYVVMKTFYFIGGFLKRIPEPELAGIVELVSVKTATWGLQGS
jgi:hypothetical protein